MNRTRQKCEVESHQKRNCLVVTVITRQTISWIVWVIVAFLIIWLSFVFIFVRSCEKVSHQDRSKTLQFSVFPVKERIRLQNAKAKLLSTAEARSLQCLLATGGLDWSRRIVLFS